MCASTNEGWLDLEQYADELLKQEPKLVAFTQVSEQLWER